VASGLPLPMTQGSPAMPTMNIHPEESALPQKNLVQTEIENSRQPNSTVGVRPVVISKDGKTQQYKVKPGDTLMKISFEMFGNLYRWKEIYEANRGKFADYKAMPIGTVLTIYGVEYVVIQRNGKPYLIKRNDTLRRISNQLYGNADYWQELWHNNPQLIQNPNQIYYGFTMYYRELNDILNQNTPKARILSSEKK
jgi:nucleoid-associated protein YgaU